MCFTFTTISIYRTHVGIDLRKLINLYVICTALVKDITVCDLIYIWLFIQFIYHTFFFVYSYLDNFIVKSYN